MGNRHKVINTWNLKSRKSLLRALVNLWKRRSVRILIDTIEGDRRRRAAMWRGMVKVSVAMMIDLGVE